MPELTWSSDTDWQNASTTDVTAENGSFQLAYAIPDSVVYQYPVSTFGTTTWTDNVGSADMSVNGMFTDSFPSGDSSVYGDGTDDYGLASGPNNLPENETFGIAFTIQVHSTPQFGPYFQSNDGQTAFAVRDGGSGNGNVELFLDDGNNRIATKTDSTYEGDGNTHAVVVNKLGNDQTDVDIYVDDMSTPQSVSYDQTDTFDPTAYSNSHNMGFYARNDSGSIGRYVEMEAGVFEFNTDPYSQSERDTFVSRRPEV